MPRLKPTRVDLEKLIFPNPTLKLTNAAAARTDAINATSYTQIPGGLVYPATHSVKMITVLFVAECTASGQLDARIKIGSKIANPSGMTLTQSSDLGTHSISGWAENLPVGDILIAIECKGQGTVNNRNLSVWIYD
jgi:hypothetical protein